MNVYYEFIDMMKQNNLNKEAVIDVLNIYVVEWVWESVEL